MTKTTYICDVCKTKFDTFSSLYHVNMVFMNKQNYERANKSFDICSSCAEKKNLIRKVIKNDKIEEEVLDIKDKLYNVMVELIQESGIPVEINQ